MVDVGLLALFVRAQVFELQNKLEVIVLLGLLDIIGVQVVLVEHTRFRLVVGPVQERSVYAQTTD